MNNSLDKLYNTLKSNELVTVGLEEFKAAYADPAYQKKVFEGASAAKLFTADEATFYETYPSKKAQDPQQDAVNGSEEPASNGEEKNTESTSDTNTDNNTESTSDTNTDNTAGGDDLTTLARKGQISKWLRMDPVAMAYELEATSMFPNLNVDRGEDGINIRLPGQTLTIPYGLNADSDLITYNQAAGDLMSVFDQYDDPEFRKKMAQPQWAYFNREDAGYHTQSGGGENYMREVAGLAGYQIKKNEAGDSWLVYKDDQLLAGEEAVFQADNPLKDEGLYEWLWNNVSDEEWAPAQEFMVNRYTEAIDKRNLELEEYLEDGLPSADEMSVNLLAEGDFHRSVLLETFRNADGISVLNRASIADYFSDPIMYTPTPGEGEVSGVEAVPEPAPGWQLTRMDEFESSDAFKNLSPEEQKVAKATLADVRGVLQRQSEQGIENLISRRSEILLEKIAQEENVDLNMLRGVSDMKVAALDFEGSMENWGKEVDAIMNNAKTQAESTNTAIEALLKEIEGAGMGYKISEDGSSIKVDYYEEDSAKGKEFQNRADTLVGSFETINSEYNKQYEALLLKKSELIKHAEDLGADSAILAREYGKIDTFWEDLETSSKGVLMNFLRPFAGSGSRMAMGAYAVTEEYDEGVEERRAAFRSPLTWEEAKAVGRKWEFSGRNFTQQLPNTVIALGGTALGIPPVGISLIFGASSYGESIGSYRSLQAQAKEATKGLDELKKQYDEGKLTDAEYYAQRAPLLAAESFGKIPEWKLQGAASTAGILEGGVGLVLGKIPNASRTFSRFLNPKSGLIPAGFRSTLGNILYGGGKLVKEAGEEVLEEEIILIGGAASDSVWLGRDIDIAYSDIEDIAIRTFTTAAPTQAPGLTYQTIVSTALSRDIYDSYLQIKSDMKDIHLAIANLDPDAPRYKERKEALQQEAIGIMEEMAPLQANLEFNAITMGAKGVKQILRSNLTIQSLLAKAGVKPTDNNQTRQKKVDKYKEGLTDKEAKAYQKELDVAGKEIQNIQNSVANGHTNLRSVEEVYGEEGMQVAEDLSKSDSEWDSRTDAEKAGRVHDRMKQRQRNRRVNKAKKDNAVVKAVEQVVYGEGGFEAWTKKTGKKNRKRAEENELYNRYATNVAIRSNHAITTRADQNISLEAISQDPDFADNLKVINVESQEQVTEYVENAFKEGKIDGETRERMLYELSKVAEEYIEGGDVSFGAIIDGSYITISDTNKTKQALENGEVLAGTVIMHEVGHAIDALAGLADTDQMLNYGTKLAEAMQKNPLLKDVHDQAMHRVQALAEDRRGTDNEMQADEFWDEYTKSVQDLLGDSLYRRARRAARELAGKSSWRNIVKMAKGKAFEIKTSKDALNYLVSFMDAFDRGEISKQSKSMISQAGIDSKKPGVRRSAASKEGDLDAKAKRKEASEKQKKASEKVQKLYEEQGIAAAMDIIDAFTPVTKRLVNKFREVPGFDFELLRDEINTGKGGLLDLIMAYKEDSGVPIAAYINKFLPLRANAAAARLLDTEFMSDVTEEKAIKATEAADALVQETTEKKKKFKTLTERGIFSSEVMSELKDKVLSIVRTLKTPLGASRTLNKTVSPLAAEIKKEAGKMLDLPIKKAMGSKKDGSLKMFVVKHKQAILENMTTAWLAKALPFTVQKRVNGEWTTDWEGKKIDRESVSTDNAGRTSGNQLMRRLPNINDKVSTEQLLSYLFTEDGALIPGRKESMAKALGEEFAFEIIEEALQNPDSDIAKAFTASMARLEDTAHPNPAAEFARQAERGNIKFSKKAADSMMTTAIAGRSDDLLGIRFSKKHRDAYEKKLAKFRPDFTKQQITEQVDLVFDFVSGNEDIPDNKKNKFEKLTLHYLAKSNLILPEDGYKVIEAERIASNKKLDPFSFDNPIEIINNYASKRRLKYIDPSSLKEFSNPQTIDEENGVVVLDVENSQEGRAAIRKIMNSHLGPQASPWCLLQVDSDGNFTPMSDDMWDKYKGISKAVFFKGKLAGLLDGTGTWWDRLDNDYEGVPAPERRTKEGKVRETGFYYEKYSTGYKIERGERGERRSVTEGNWNTGVVKTEIYSKEADDYALEKREQYVNGKLNGTSRYYHTDEVFEEDTGESYLTSTLVSEIEYKDGVEHGLYTYHTTDYVRNTTYVSSRTNYENGKRVGVGTEYDRRGNISGETLYKEGEPVRGYNLEVDRQAGLVTDKVSSVITELDGEEGYAYILNGGDKFTEVRIRKPGSEYSVNVRKNGKAVVSGKLASDDKMLYATIIDGRITDLKDSSGESVSVENFNPEKTLGIWRDGVQLINNSVPFFDGSKSIRFSKKSSYDPNNPADLIERDQMMADFVRTLPQELVIKKATSKGITLNQFLFAAAMTNAGGQSVYHNTKDLNDVVIKAYGGLESINITKPHKLNDLGQLIFKTDPKLKIRSAVANQNTIKGKLKIMAEMLNTTPAQNKRRREALEFMLRKLDSFVNDPKINSEIREKRFRLVSNILHSAKRNRGGFIRGGAMIDSISVAHGEKNPFKLEHSNPSSVFSDNVRDSIENNTFKNDIKALIESFTISVAHGDIADNYDVGEGKTSVVEGLPADLKLAKDNPSVLNNTIKLNSGLTLGKHYELALKRGEVAEKHVEGVTELLAEWKTADYGPTPRQKVASRASKLPKEKSEVTRYHGGRMGSIKEATPSKPIYVASDRKQAELHAGKNAEDKVMELYVDGRYIVDETTAYDIIRELGLSSQNKDRSVSELSLFELLNPNFSTSLSKADITKLYNELSNRGYKGIQFYDTDLQTKGQTALNTVIFDRSAVSDKPYKNIKFSRGVKFNEILEETKGVKAKDTFSAAKAKIKGKKYDRFRLNLFIPPSANDFAGLIYSFLGKGKVGEDQYKWFKENLFDPFTRGTRTHDVMSREVRNGWVDLKSKLKDTKKRLKKPLLGTEYTAEDALRVFLWNKAGYEIPGMDAKEVNDLVRKVKADPQLREMAAGIENLANKANGITKPNTAWLEGSVSGDLFNSINEARADHLKEWIEAKNDIFTAANMNKIQAVYGTKFREALEDTLHAMEHGRSKYFANQDKWQRRLSNWMAASVGTTMFLNMRSAALQTLSAVNFINWTDNNPLKAAQAFANQKQYWSDWVRIFNSPWLKERRGGIKTDVNVNDLMQEVSASDNPLQAALGHLLRLGFIPTQIMDSVAIASGGATFFRNRTNTYIKQGMSKIEAEKKAFEDTIDASEPVQQSTRADMTSQQQRSLTGKIFLTFQNTTMQYNRRIKKAAQDLVNGRGDWKEHVSRIVYYGAVQNLIFNYLSQALFSMLTDDDEEDEKEWNKRQARMINGMIDSLLRGGGIAGSILASAKNAVIKASEEWGKDMPDWGKPLIEALNVAPSIGMKTRKVTSGLKTLTWNKKMIEQMSTGDIDNPMWEGYTSIAEGLTDVPVNRLYRKLQNMSEALNSENEWWQRTALALGWNTWNLGITPKGITEAEAALDKAKEEEKAKKKQLREDKKEAKAIVEEKEREREQDKERERGGKVYCKASKKDGSRCGLEVEGDGDYCTVHQKVEQRKDGKQVQCSHVKPNGKRCGMKTSNASGKCYYHD